MRFKRHATFICFIKALSLNKEADLLLMEASIIDNTKQCKLITSGIITVPATFKTEKGQAKHRQKTDIQQSKWKN